LQLKINAVANFYAVTKNYFAVACFPLLQPNYCQNANKI